MSHLLEQLEGRERRAECLRNEARLRLDELRALLCAVATVGQIDGYDVIRRESVIDLVDRSRAFFAECEADARDVMRGAA